MIDEEHQAWGDLFEEAKEVFQLSSTQLNTEPYKRFFKLIERWAYYDRERRKENPEVDKFKGCLWNGTEEDLN